MVTRRLAAVVGATAALVAAVPPAHAETTLTAAGPATVRGSWLGGVTSEGRPPEVAVGWVVTVGRGGNAGPVRLRVLRPGDRATVVGSGPTEWLPAAPGSYRFALWPGIPYDERDAGLALDQSVGRHAIVKAHIPQPALGPSADPAQLHALDVFRPPLSEGARDVGYSERRLGGELLVRGVIERDLDRDRLGDVSQDAGDLRLVRARVRERHGAQLWVEARVHNVGTSLLHLPHIVVPADAREWDCRPRPLPDWPILCPGPPLAPGDAANVAVGLRLAGGRAPARVEVAAEGPDTHPADNSGPLAPLLRLRAVDRQRLTFSLSSTHRGRARVAARVAGRRLMRAVRFGTPGRRTVRLLPVGRRARHALAAALRRTRRPRAVVTATMGGARGTLRLRL